MCTYMSVLVNRRCVERFVCFLEGELDYAFYSNFGYVI